MAKKVNPNNKQGKDAFVAIGQNFLKANSADDIITLFKVFKGGRSQKDAVLLMPNCSAVENYSLNTHDTSDWKGAAAWAEWWLQR